VSTRFTRALPDRPHLDHLKHQAKNLLDAFRGGDAGAAAEVRSHFRGADPATFALHDAQLVLARAYGFDSWPKLKAYVDGATARRLCDAVMAGDLDTVRDMLAARPELVGFDLSETDERQALHFAVLGRQPEMVRLLMRHGADARKGIYPHRDATTALTMAVERGDEAIVAILREEEGARQSRTAVGTVDDAGAMTVWRAFGTGDIGRAFELLDATPTLIDQPGPDGKTLLYWAAGTLHPEVVDGLLARGATVADRDLAFAMAGAAWGRRATPDRIRAVAASLRRAGAGLTPVSAVALGDVAWVRARHAAGALPPEGLIKTAVLHDRREMLDLLLELGLDPGDPVRIQEYEPAVYSIGGPLQHCAGAGKYELAEILLARGADPNTGEYAAGTAVSSAYRARDARMLDLLERHGGIVTAGTAAYHRDVDRVRQFLELEDRGRLPAGVVDPGEAVAEALLGGDCGEPEIIALALARIDWPSEDPRWYRVLRGPLSFWSHVPWIVSPEWPFPRDTYLQCFQLILARCHPNVSGSFGRTILHDVMAMGRRGVGQIWITDEEVAAFAEVLVKAGARLDARDAFLESTPLGWACRWGRLAAARVLLEHGADPVEADAEPWATPRAWGMKTGNDALMGLLDRFTGIV
jgi:ankyrin repeat protein